MRAPSTPDPRRAIRRVYRGVDAFDVPESEEDVVVARRSSPLYGEIMPAATGHLLDYLALGARDVLYDLGSGAGKAILQAAMTVRIRRCVGIELVRPRHAMGLQALRRAEEQGLLRSPVELWCRDFMRAPIADATVLYTCSTAFPQDLMQRLARRLRRHPAGTRLVTLRDLDDNPWLDLVDVLRLDMSWRRRAKVHVYRRR